MRSCFGEFVKKGAKKSEYKKKVNDLLKDSELQAIFVYGEWIDSELYYNFRRLCEERQIFVSNIYFNDESGCVVAVNDYNAFAEEQLKGEDSNFEASNQRSVNLFGKLHKNTFKKWTRDILKPKKGKIEEQEHIVLNAAKNLYIGHSEKSEGLLLKHPLYPTIFNKFFLAEDQKKYTKYYFKSK